LLVIWPPRSLPGIFDENDAEAPRVLSAQGTDPIRKLVIGHEEPPAATEGFRITSRKFAFENTHGVYLSRYAASLRLALAEDMYLIFPKTGL
jgi:hypothetical protein